MLKVAFGKCAMYTKQEINKWFLTYQFLNNCMGRIPLQEGREDVKADEHPGHSSTSRTGDNVGKVKENYYGQSQNYH